mgnify:CR=1 FL=1
MAKIEPFEWWAVYLEDTALPWYIVETKEAATYIARPGKNKVLRTRVIRVLITPIEEGKSDE